MKPISTEEDLARVVAERRVRLRERTGLASSSVSCVRCGIPLRVTVSRTGAVAVEFLDLAVLPARPMAQALIEEAQRLNLGPIDSDTR